MTQLIDQIKPADRAPSAEATVRLSLGLAHLGLREIAEADPLLHDAVRLDANSWRAKIGLARFLLLKRDKSGAAEQIEAARAIAPDNVEVMRLNGEIMRSKGDTDGAVAEFSKIISARPNDIAALVSRANAYLGQNKLTEADQDMATALKLAPKSPLGDLSQRVDPGAAGEAGGRRYPASIDQQHVRRDAQRILSRGRDQILTRPIRAGRREPQQIHGAAARPGGRPQAPGANRAAPKRSRRGGRIAEADLGKDPTDQASASLLARAYVAQGKSDQAVELYERSAEQQPDNIRAQTAAAVMRMSYGERTRAWPISRR